MKKVGGGGDTDGGMISLLLTTATIAAGLYILFGRRELAAKLGLRRLGDDAASSGASAIDDGSNADATKTSSPGENESICEGEDESSGTGSAGEQRADRGKGVEKDGLTGSLLQRIGIGLEALGLVQDSSVKGPSLLRRANTSSLLKRLGIGLESIEAVEAVAAVDDDASRVSDADPVMQKKLRSSSTGSIMQECGIGAEKIELEEESSANNHATRISGTEVPRQKELRRKSTDSFMHECGIGAQHITLVETSSAGGRAS